MNSFLFLLYVVASISRLLPQDAEVLKKKIEQLIPDQPKGKNTILEMRKNIFDNVWKQRKYTNETSYSSIFYVMVTERENNTLSSTEYSCHPVFRCKKCSKESDSSNCCMIYVDEVGRVYQNWESYLKENVLPPGIMVLPDRGVYNFDEQKNVILTVRCTPKGTPEAKAMAEVQSISAFAGLGASCVPIAALAMPIAAPVMVGASIIGLGVGALTALTSIINLHDRGKHGQSTSISNREARASYIGIIGGAVGIAASSTTRLMTSMASAGKSTKGLEVLVNGMNISSIAISGSGVANGVFDLIFKYKDGDKITSMDVLQLSASLVLFTHSVHNFQLASKLANSARNNSIKSYRETLSNRQRKMFDKMAKETFRIRGGTQGKMDIIRGVNEIPDRQYLNDLFKINKQLNQKGVRPSFGESGKGIVLNNETPVNTGELRRSVQHQQGPDLLKQVSQPIPSTYNSETYTTQTPKQKQFFASGVDARYFDALANEDNWKESPMELGVALRNGSTIMLKIYGIDFLKNISNIEKFKDILIIICEKFMDTQIKFILEVAQKFVNDFKQEIERKIQAYISTETVLYQIIKHILDNCEKYCYDQISTLEAIRKHFLKFIATDPHGVIIKCTDCSGQRTITRLQTTE